MSSPAAATMPHPRGASVPSSPQPRTSVNTTAISTAAQAIRWASTSTGTAGASSGQNAGNSPQIVYAPTAAATPRPSSPVPATCP